MPVGTRIRAHNAYGATTDNPLLIGSTSFNSTQLQLLPAVVSPLQHAVVVLDPRRVFGEPEIVVVTAHVGFASTATITRATYGTTARAHPVNTAWVHIEIDEDFIEPCTSTTRPSNPYIGQFISEEDTLSLKHYNGLIWNSSPPIGTLLPFLDDVIPSGYLRADGSNVSRTGVTADLFAVLGTTYGTGDGITTFTLPNLKTRIPVGRNVADAEFDVLGETGGEKEVTLDASKMVQHSHVIQDFQHRHGETTHDHSVVNLPFVGANANHVHGGSISGGGAHDHQTTGPGQPVMVIAAGAGPFSVAAPGTDFVTFDVGGSARTSGVGDHGHTFTFDNSGNLMQPALTNQSQTFTGIIITQNTPVSQPSFPTHNNLQPYITVNYIIKI